mgnify:FL=1
MSLCVMCQKPMDSDQQRRGGFCEICWEREQALTDEAIARAAKVLKNLAGEARR